MNGKIEPSGGDDKRRNEIQPSEYLGTHRWTFAFSPQRVSSHGGLQCLVGRSSPEPATAPNLPSLETVAQNGSPIKGGGCTLSDGDANAIDFFSKNQDQDQEVAES